jgi:hypothetical protein
MARDQKCTEVPVKPDATEREPDGAAFLVMLRSTDRGLHPPPTLRS